MLRAQRQVDDANNSSNIIDFFILYLIWREDTNNLLLLQKM
jgi:hypothetical protein